MEIVPVRTKQDRKLFAVGARLLHRKTAEYVPPLDSDVMDFTNPDKNPFFREAEIDHFMAVENGRLLGRISATVEPRYVDAHGPVGWFGFFDCLDDGEVARALLGTVEDWLRRYGMPRVEGPYSYNATQEFGLLRSGFEQVPAVMQPHNERYYDDLLRGAGYQPRYTTQTYTWRKEDADVLERIRERADRTCEQNGLVVRSLDTRRWDAEIEQLWELFLSTFSQQHDMIPMTRTVFDWQFAQLRSFVDPQLLRFVEHDGKPIAFSFLIADVNEVLRKAGGRKRPLFLLRYPWLRRGVTGAVVLMIGVRPGYERLGAGRALAGEIADVALGRVGRYNKVHTTWIHEQNASSRALVNRTGSEPRRTYAVYRKTL